VKPNLLAIEFSFPCGRYHATPWDAHVNEGIVEWPPSPWRILRGLIATRHLKAAEVVSEETLARIVEALSAELPLYALPLGGSGFHSRHYMPLFSGKTTKVFDTFLHFPRGSRLVVAWPQSALDPDLVSPLECLIERLGYLGRAEALVEGRFCDAESLTFDCRPAVAPAGRDTDAQGEYRGVIRLLAPVPPAELVRWRGAALDERNSRALNEKIRRAREKGKPEDSVKLSTKEIAALETSLPTSVYETLTVETDVMRKGHWSRPPGSRWVDYTRPRLESRLDARTIPPPRVLPTVARYALAGQVLPRLTDTVFEAERIRTALLSQSGAAPVFSGRDPVTGALLTGHRHAFFIPEANGRHGHITHITLYARMGFDDLARAALERLNRVWQRSGHDLQMVLLGVGDPEDFAGTRAEAGQCPLLVAADTWESRTPFVPTRHPKSRRTGQQEVDEHGLIVGSPEHDLVRLLIGQGFPRPHKTERMSATSLGGKPTRWLAFRTERRKGHGRRAGLHGVGFRVTFSSPIRGPLAVGYGAHFGLGCFVPLP
jgi:CRISPR-associated protein Csb2